jgi:uncharacterized MAPEG superfamily protein
VTPTFLRSPGSQDAWNEHFENFLETFPVFVTAVFLVQFLGRESVFSEWGLVSIFQPG